jgi:hypothetical protein
MEPTWTVDDVARSSRSALAHRAGAFPRTITEKVLEDV